MGKISYLARDSKGAQQIFLISPLGGEPVQVTEHHSDVQSGARWSPDNQSIAYIWDNSIVLCEISDQPFEKRAKRLTAKTTDTPSNLVWSNDGRTMAFNRSVSGNDKSDQKKQIFVINLATNK